MPRVAAFLNCVTVFVCLLGQQKKCRQVDRAESSLSLLQRKRDIIMRSTQGRGAKNAFSYCNEKRDWRVSLLKRTHHCTLHMCVVWTIHDNETRQHDVRLSVVVPAAYITAPVRHTSGSCGPPPKTRRASRAFMRTCNLRYISGSRRWGFYSGSSIIIIIMCRHRQIRALTALMTCTVRSDLYH